MIIIVAPTELEVGIVKTRLSVMYVHSPSTQVHMLLVNIQSGTTFSYEIWLGSSYRKTRLCNVKHGGAATAENSGKTRILTLCTQLAPL